MTDNEACVVAMLIAQRMDLAQALCDAVNAQCSTHRFLVETTGTARLAIRVQGREGQP